MRRILSLLDETAGEELIFPVTPSSYTWEKGARIETISLDRTGDLALFGGKTLASATLELLLPATLYSFCNPGALADPEHYLTRLGSWLREGRVLRWLVSGTGVNAQVLLESLRYGEADGTNDVTATLKLRQYRLPQAPLVETGSSERPSGTGAAQRRTYTVVKGDSLWGIARKFYGDGSLYLRLAAANSAIIKNPNLIYPGQVLTIPAIGELPAAKTVSTSVQIAQETKTVYDSALKLWRLVPGKDLIPMVK